MRHTLENETNMYIEKIPARAFLGEDPASLWGEDLNVVFGLTFDDGGYFESTLPSIITSRYAWEFHNRYPALPLNSNHFIGSVVDRSTIQYTVHNKLIETVLFDTLHVYRPLVDDYRPLVNDLSQLGYTMTNRLYNDLVRNTKKYASTIDLFHLLDIVTMPEVVSLVSNAPPTEEGVDSINKGILDLLKTHPALKDNPVAASIRAGVCRVGQLLQMLGVRGFVTDMDSKIFRKPIMQGYVRGVTDLYSSLIDTRSASKAMANTTRPLEIAEYFSRRQQLLCGVLINLFVGDCGSNDYINWFVKKEHLLTIAGLTQLSPDGIPRHIRKSDTHLVGQTIKVRNIFGCNKISKQGICETCYGAISLGVPMDTVIGSETAITFTGPVGQIIISTKHHEGSSKVAPIRLDTFSKYFLDTKGSDNTYHFNARLKSKNAKLYVNVADAESLGDVRLTDTNLLSIHRISQIESIAIGEMVEDDGITEEVIQSVVLRLNDRKASISTPLLQYIKEMGYTTDGGSYVIDLSKWNFDEPAFILPMVHLSMGTFQSAVASMLESSTSEMYKRSTCTTPEALAMELYDAVNEKLPVNYTTIATIVLCSTARNPLTGDYALGKSMGVMRSIMKSRSASATFAFERHKGSVFEPQRYLDGDVLNHPMDSILCPNEVLGIPELLK